MDCPVCQQPLGRTNYEGTRVLQCEKCAGYLVARRRLRLIRTSRQLSPEDLAAEAEGQHRPDSDAAIRCPKCRDRRMKKERVRMSEDEAFMMDVCPKCDHVWFDGGELARLQIKFEKSAQAVDAFARQEQLQTMSEDRREALDEQIDRLSERENFLQSAVGEMMIFGAALVLLFATAASHLWEARAATAVFSLLFSGLIAWTVAQRLDITRGQRIAALVAVAVAEVLYLALPVGLFW